MRIALLSRRFDPSGGGTERDLIITADYLRRGGHQVTIYAGEIRGEADRHTVRAVPISAPGRALKLWQFAYAAPVLARREGAELVLSFGRTVGADVLRPGGGAHISYIRAARKWRGALAAAAMRLSPYHRTQMRIERCGFGSPRLKLAIAIAKLVRDDLIRQFKLPEEKVVTLYNGVDLERFRPAADRESRRRIRQALRLPESAPVAIFVGNGFARKGLGYLLEAWPKIRAKPSLLVVGNDRAAESYKKQARALNVADRVLFLGPRNDIPDLFHAVDALALPSLFEAFGNVVLEAMASGLKVITSLDAGAAEVIPESLRSFTIQDATNPDEIGRRIGMLIEAPKELGAEARAAAESYSWDRYGENLLRLLEGVGPG